jgi:hypothetical protein
MKKPNTIDCNGETPLIKACKEMNWEIVSRLVTKDNVNHPDTKGLTPLHWIMKRTTTITDCMEAVESLLSNQAEVNSQDSTGKTPLHFSAEAGLNDACNLLVKRGANLTIVDALGETPLHRSVCRPGLLQGKNCVLQTLIDLKADVTIKRKDGKTAADVIAAMLSQRSWTDPQKVALEVALRRLRKAVEDRQKA